MNPWLVIVLTSLSVYRLTRLVVDDTFPPVLWLRDRLVGGWRAPTMKEQHHDQFPSAVVSGGMASGEIAEGALMNVAGLGLFTVVDGQVQIYRRKSKWSPFWLASLLSCPYCASGWIALAVTGGAWWWLGLSVLLAVLLWLASWALGGLLAAQEWS